MTPALYAALMGVDACTCERSVVEFDDRAPVVVRWWTDPQCVEIHVRRA